MFRPTPIKLSDEARQVVSGQLNQQIVQRSAPKSLDPKNFPVFEIPVNKKVLIYVPNHVVDGPEGEELLMDKPLIHPVREGKRFLSYRCTQGIILNDEEGNPIYDGSCPFCDGTDVPWDLANISIKNKCAQAGLDPEDKENTQVKAIRTAEFSARALKEPNRYFTFPIVVIATVNDDGKTMVKDEKGKPTCTPMWYTISENQYIKAWKTCFEGMEDEPTHPGGRFFTLNYTYDTKGKEANKRDSAQNLSVIARNLKGGDKLKEFLDKSTVDWTPAKAQETVVNNLLYPLSDMQKVADSILENPREMISLLTAAAASGSANTDGFSLKAPTEEVKSLEAATSVQGMDETDED